MKRVKLEEFIPFDLVNVIFTFGSKKVNERFRCANPYVFDIAKENTIVFMYYKPNWKEFINLQTLSCSNLGWTTLPEDLLDVNINIDAISVSYNNLNELPRWNHVRIVCCSSNFLKKLPNWPNVKKVLCAINQLREELPNWKQVEVVMCYDNFLKTLPNWPMIQEVDCSHNQLRKLPNWPMVQKVNCSYNNLTKLPDWPTATYVNCRNNFLNPMPNLSLRDPRVVCANPQKEGEPEEEEEGGVCVI